MTDHAAHQLQVGLGTLSASPEETRRFWGAGAGSSRSTSVLPHLGQLGCAFDSITYIRQLLHPTATITSALAQDTAAESILFAPE
jgi:hypothetical protein